LGDFFEGRVILIVFSVTNKAKKNMFISDLPTDPKILPPTLTFFMPKI
jgi:hypothetical protein